MTWWGALGLALALYGVVVLLEWLYDQIVRTHTNVLTPISVVVRFADQEEHIEHMLRDLARIFSERQWERREFEVVLADAGSRDHTRDIIDRLFGQHPYFRVAAPSLSDDQILAECRYPIVVWLDLTRQGDRRRLLGTVARLLGGVGPA